MADIFFVPAPARVIPEMLKIAAVSGDDLVMDLGSGDGQILIAAARECGARGIGVEIDPVLVAQAARGAASAGVSERLTFVEEDLFRADLRAATVLMLYLLETINIRLRPKILRECRPGTRVVTYSFEMGEWQCDAHTPIAANGVSLWVVPANLSGEWRAEPCCAGAELTQLSLQQRYQELSGTATWKGVALPVTAGRARGCEFSLSLESTREPLTISGRIEEDEMRANFITADGGVCEWRGLRTPGTMQTLDPGAA